MGTKVKLQNVRLFFNDLFEAKAFQPGDTPRYSAVFGVPKSDKKQLALLEAAFKAEATEGWKTKADVMLKSFRPQSGKFCLRDGDDVTWEGAEGCMVLTAHRKQSDGRPNVRDARNTQIAPEDGTIYSGCYVNAYVDIWGQTKKDMSGIRCSLIGVQKYADGDSFSGAAKPSDDDFEDISTGADAEDLA